jgi:hypothetical protein
MTLDELRTTVGIKPRGVTTCDHRVVIIRPIDAKLSLRYCLECLSPVGRVGKWIE